MSSALFEVDIETILQEAAEACELAHGDEERALEDEELESDTAADASRGIETLLDIWRGELIREKSRQEQEVAIIDNATLAIGSENVEKAWLPLPFTYEAKQPAPQQSQHDARSTFPLQETFTRPTWENQRAPCRGCKVWRESSRNGVEIQDTSEDDLPLPPIHARKITPSNPPKIEHVLKLICASKKKWEDLTSSMKKRSSRGTIAEQVYAFAPTAQRMQEPQQENPPLKSCPAILTFPSIDLMQKERDCMDNYGTVDIQVHPRSSSPTLRLEGPPTAGILSKNIRVHLLSSKHRNIFPERDLSFEGLSDADLDDLNISDEQSILLDGNLITSTAKLSKFSNLQKLSAVANRVTELDGISRMKQLRCLNLGWNQLASLPILCHLPLLEWLSVEYNLLRNLKGLDKCRYLKTLVLRGNLVPNLDDLPFNSQIRVLDIAFNPIASLSGIEQTCPLLVQLLAESCQLCAPGSLALPDLQVLDLRGNLISGLSWLYSIRSIQLLDLSFNALSNESEVSDFLLWCSPRFFDITGNPISDKYLNEWHLSGWHVSLHDITTELCRAHYVFQVSDFDLAKEKSALVIQTHWRRLRAFRAFKKLRSRKRKTLHLVAAVRIQSCWRGYQARRQMMLAAKVRQLEIEELHYAAVVIQACWLGFRTRCKFLQAQKHIRMQVLDLDQEIFNEIVNQPDKRIDFELRPTMLHRNTGRKTKDSPRPETSQIKKGVGKTPQTTPTIARIDSADVSDWGIANSKTADLLIRSQQRKLQGQRSKELRSKLQDPMERLKRFHARVLPSSYKNVDARRCAAHPPQNHSVGVPLKKFGIFGPR